MASAVEVIPDHENGALVHVFQGGTARRAMCNHHCAPDAADYVSVDFDALMHGAGDERIRDATCPTCLEQVAAWREWIAAGASG